MFRREKVRRVVSPYAMSRQSCSVEERREALRWGQSNYVVAVMLWHGELCHRTQC